MVFKSSKVFSFKSLVKRICQDCVKTFFLNTFTQFAARWSKILTALLRKIFFLLNLFYSLLPIHKIQPWTLLKNLLAILIDLLKNLLALSLAKLRRWISRTQFKIWNLTTLGLILKKNTFQILATTLRILTIQIAHRIAT